jgi:hypothetical protein
MSEQKNMKKLPVCLFIFMPDIISPYPIYFCKYRLHTIYASFGYATRYQEDLEIVFYIEKSLDEIVQRYRRRRSIDSKNIQIVE